MERRDIDPFDYASEIVKANPRGILFTTKADGEVDTMVIGWGLIGNVWGLPMFTAFIRTSRHSHDLVEKAGEFTVNIPQGTMDPKIFKVAGRQSGRNVNKVEELGLTLVDGREVDVPAIAECPITLECDVVYKQLFDESAMPPDILANYYPADITDIDASGASCYQHVAYYGNIVDSYILEP